MNQGQPYMDVSHPQASPSGPASGHYGYGQPQPLQPASHYPTSYGGYSYANTMAPMSAGHPVTSSMGGQMVQPLPIPPNMAPTQAPPPGQGYPNHQQTMDTTGQIAPAGMKPRVTATLWEDEGSLCFQVEAQGVCVARREDNHMINGTKLLNVAGMTRGRRDGILKSEKTRHVVKIGPMHLKGVWIPFDRALEFANKEKITEMLYPLFVHNIGALLYHPTNQARQSIGNAAMAARRPEQSQQDYMRTPQGTHHHSIPTPMSASMSLPPQSIAPYPPVGRPGLDRAQTFPTPPASASSLTIGLGNSGNSYDSYGGAQSAPINPATTPPQHAQPVQYQTTQAYDNSRQMYSAPASYGTGAYASQQPPMTRYNAVQSSPAGVKNEMGPPARTGAENEHPEGKSHDSYATQQDADGEHEGDYTHNRPIHSDPSHMPSDMSHGQHQNGSGRATPRTTTTYTGYSTPQRASQLPSSNLNYVMSNDSRSGAPNGTDGYSQVTYQPQQYPAMNGSAPPSNKRVRDVDDQEDPYSRPMSAGGDAKRQRMDSGVVRPIAQPQSVKAGPMRR
ncbi:Cell pattern formation-associated protein stuA [Acrodontium crateriforme]|uniref:Cell pattern formation-associated protein stuA n=1 Tax=Acrodontium crateriforme TaxID=150365 RepID=A0AAQ3R764_9PEZI|nr:Cell pattern formation-associated protein stuA [Acrodontium crateriforme]